MKSEIINFNRIGRTKFLAYTNISYVLISLVYYVVVVIGFGEDAPVHEVYFKNLYLFIFLSVLSTLPLKFLAQRYKDTGLSPWWALVGLIPTSFYMLYILLGSYRGENYANRHGSIPTKSNVFIRLLAFIPIILLACFISWYYLNNT